MLYQINSSKSLDEIERGLQESAARHQFGVIAVHDLRDTMKKKGVDLDIECRIYEVCNPLQAKRVLETDGAISTALGCRISVFGSQGHYTLANLPVGPYILSVKVQGFKTYEQRGIVVEVGSNIQINAAMQIGATAQEYAAAAVVMATHGRTGVVRSILGSVAGGVLHHSTSPVVLIHPAELRAAEEPLLHLAAAGPAE